jgi:hypothetical protein
MGQLAGPKSSATSTPPPGCCRRCWATATHLDMGLHDGTSHDMADGALRVTQRLCKACQHISQKKVCPADWADGRGHPPEGPAKEEAGVPEEQPPREEEEGQQEAVEEGGVPGGGARLPGGQQVNKDQSAGEDERSHHVAQLRGGRD